MIEVEELGHVGLAREPVHLLTVAVPEQLCDPIALPSACFKCLIAWDAEDASAACIAAVAARLLEAGCVYLCTWGADCQRVHDLCDEVVVHRELESPQSESEREAVVMTTWHDTETWSEALEFALHGAWPDDLYAERCRGLLVVLVGEHAARSDELRAAVRAE